MVPSPSVEVEVKFTVSGAFPEVGVAVKLAKGGWFGCAKAGLTGNVARKQRKSAENIKILVFI